MAAAIFGIAIGLLLIVVIASLETAALGGTLRDLFE